MSLLRTDCKNSQKDKYVGKVNINYNSSFSENNFLIFWEEENSVSVIFGKGVWCVDKSIGNECQVSINGADLKGKIATKGKHLIGYCINYEYK